jgi:HEAT repeat protein
MTPDDSPALARFTASLDTTDPRELTYDVGALRDLVAEERGRAVDVLAGRVASGDVRAIETALAVPLPELEPAIRALGDAASGPAREAAARALTRFGDQDALRQLIDRLAKGHPMIRINAAYELAQSDDPLATDALLRALVDEEVIVRVHAWHGLVRRFGLDAVAEVRHSPLGTLFVLLVSDVPGSTIRGAERLRAIVARLRDGATPAELGLDVAPPPDDAPVDAFVASMRDDASPIDVAAVRAMDELHREWAIAIIVAAAGRRDPRVGPALEALEALDVAWASEAVARLPAE